MKYGLDESWDPPGLGCRISARLSRGNIGRGQRRTVVVHSTPSRMVNVIVWPSSTLWHHRAQIAQEIIRRSGVHRIDPDQRDVRKRRVAVNRGGVVPYARGQKRTEARQPESIVRVRHASAVSYALRKASTRRAEAKQPNWYFI